jgi:hypothetical protein
MLSCSMRCSHVDVGSQATPTCERRQYDEVLIMVFLVYQTTELCIQCIPDLYRYTGIPAYYNIVLYYLIVIIVNF